MNLDQIETKCFILALFIRDDGERFLLGSRAYEFVDSQLHFAANSYQNDVVEVQGNDGLMLAGQVRRATSQAFDGYIGDSSVNRSTIEQYRRDFMKFFRKNHYYKVVYVFPDGTAVQRRNGFIVEAPEVKELYQLFPKYHISMNFEDINYYNYEEDSEGEEIYGESAALKIATAATGGLIWSNSSSATLTGEGTNFTLEGTVNGNAISDVQLKGDTFQQTYSGKNLLDAASMTGRTYSGLTTTVNGDGTLTISGTASDTWGEFIANMPIDLENGETYTLSIGNALPFNFVGYADSPRQNFLIEAGQTSATLTMNSDKTSLHFYGSGFTVDQSYNVTVTNIQLEKSSTATSYEPYVGGIPAPNPDYPQEVQTATGRQVVEVYGKNLFDKDNPNLLTAFVNYVVGEIQSSATAKTVYIPITGGETYTVSKMLSSRFTLGTTANVPAISEPLINKLQNNSATVLSLATSDTANYLCVDFYRSSEDTATIEEIMNSIQIEKGSTATPYQTHQSYEVNLGKNLFDIDVSENGGINSDGENVAAADNWRTIGYIEAQPNTTYTYSMNGSISSIQWTIRFYQYDVNHNFISPRTEVNRNNITITTGPNTRYIRLSIYIFNVTTTKEIIENSMLQLEKGSTATSYAPYFEPIELCKIGDYQDYIYQSGSDWYLHKEIGRQVVTGGAEDWSTSGGFGRANIATSAFADGEIADYTMSGRRIGYLFCNMFHESVNDGIGSIFAFYGNIVPYFPASVTNLASANTWLANNAPIVYYALAAPTDTQITNADLVSQLNALAGATTYDGQTVFTVTSENQLAILSLSTISDGGGGVVWDQYGAEWEEGTGGGPTMIDVDSIDNVYPVWTVTGPAVNPQISVLTTNTTLSYSGTVTSSQELKIDMFNKTATLNGVSVIGNVSGDWIYLKPGINRVTYTTNNADAPDATIWWQEIVG